MYEVKLTTGASFPIENGQTILDAATIANMQFPYSCKNGRCGSCKSKVVNDGKTTIIHNEIGLSNQEKMDGWILSCARSVVSDIILEAECLDNVILPSIKTLPCRIHRLKYLSSDVIQVILRIPPSAVFSFLPGQYIDILGPKELRRSYSLANAYPTDNLLELHIRAVAGGLMSNYWFNEAKVNDLLRFNGPLGTFFLREHDDLDVVFLATGTGIAPVKSMIESLITMLHVSSPRSVSVFWGGRSKSDLYFDISSILGPYQYIPVLSRIDDGWFGARGYIQNVFFATQNCLENTMVYACGSINMIESAHTLLSNNGLPNNRFYSDAFVCSASN